MGKQETLDTIWEVPDELWERVEAIILEEDPPKARGRKRADARQMLNGIIFRLRSGPHRANGTDYRESLGTTAPSIAPFNGGWNGVSWAECGEP